MKQLKEYEKFRQYLNNQTHGCQRCMMHLAGRNNPCGAKEPDRDASDKAK